MKKIIFSLMCGVLLLGITTGCENNAPGKDDSKANNITINAPEELEVKTYISNSERQLIVSVTNKSGETVGSGYMNISYYDENNNELDTWGSTSQRYNMLESGKETVFGFELPIENASRYYVPAKTEVEITIDEEYKKGYVKQISEFEEKFSYSHTDDGSVITVNITNNSNHSEFMPRHISTVFYKNNRPIYAIDSIMGGTLGAGEVKTKTVKIPKDFEKSKETGDDVLLDYDSVKIFRVVEGNS